MATKQINFKNWLGTQKIFFDSCSAREKRFLERAYERITIDKEPTYTQKQVLEVVKKRHVHQEKGFLNQMSFIGNSHGRLAEINKREIISDNSEVVERIKNLSYKNTLKRIPLNPNCEFVDILGNKYESKAEVNISNAMISIEWLTGVKLEFYHPDVIRFSDVNITREKFIDLVKPELLKMAGWVH